MFSGHLEELREIFRKKVQPTLHARRAAELAGAANALFIKVNDAIREAARMAAGRTLTTEALAETSREGLREIFGSKWSRFQKM